MTDQFPRTFIAQRDEDVSGVSGEGVIAEGVMFSDGWVVTHWLDKPPMHEPKTDVWHNKGTTPFERIHGHGGSTRILWTDEVAGARRELAADIVEAFAVPGWVAGPDTECEVLRRRIAAAVQEVQDGEAALVEVGDERIVQAVMPVVAQLQRERDRARRAAGRAYQLADRWQAAHGASMFLVRVAGAELRDELDDCAARDGEVVHPEPTVQVSGPQRVDESKAPGLRGLMRHAGIDTTGRDNTVDGSVTDAALLPAVECSAQYLGDAEFGARQCIRAGQHRGDHIDAHGFHWSDTVAMYPVMDGTLRESPAAAIRRGQRHVAEGYASEVQSEESAADCEHLRNLLRSETRRADAAIKREMVADEAREEARAKLAEAQATIRDLTRALRAVEAPAADATTPADGTPDATDAPQCDGCGHPTHPARGCPVTLYGERCACDEPIVVEPQQGEAQT